MSYKSSTQPVLWMPSVTKSRYPKVALEEDVILLRTFEAISREIDRQTNNQTKQVRCTITLQFGSLTSTIATSTSTSALSHGPKEPKPPETPYDQPQHPELAHPYKEQLKPFPLQTSFSGLPRT